ncbi:MAG: hypothetical protein ACTSQK_11510, partial [Candidatus Heimdallarchaeota archaeon]
IDLEPLIQCQELVSIDVSSNSLTEIDLQPLSMLKNLDYIGLRHNNLGPIDISPLRACESLQSIYINKDHPIEWKDSVLDIKALPDYLRKVFLKKIRVARDKYLKERK